MGEGVVVLVQALGVVVVEEVEEGDVQVETGFVVHGHVSAVVWQLL